MGGSVNKFANCKPMLYSVKAISSDSSFSSLRFFQYSAMSFKNKRSQQSEIFGILYPPSFNGSAKMSIGILSFALPVTKFSMLFVISFLVGLAVDTPELYMRCLCTHKDRVQASRLAGFFFPGRQIGVVREGRQEPV